MSMVLNIRDYNENKLFSGNKGSEENAIVARFIKTINEVQFKSVPEVLNYFGNNFEGFLKSNHCESIPYHYGFTLTNLDFQQIVSHFGNFINDLFVPIPEEKTISDDLVNTESVEMDTDYNFEALSDYQSLASRSSVDRMVDELDYNDGNKMSQQREHSKVKSMGVSPAFAHYNPFEDSSYLRDN